MCRENVTKGEIMLPAIWFIALYLFFAMGLSALYSMNLMGILFCIASFVLCIPCLLGFYWSLIPFRPSPTTMQDDEEINHSK